MKDLTEFLKAAVRPYIVCYTWTIIGLMWLQQMEIPELLLVAGTAVVGEYILERAIKRLKE